MKLFALAGLLLAAVALGADDTARLELKNERLTLQLDRERGAIVSLRHGDTDELIATQAKPRLFVLTLCAKAEKTGRRFYVGSDTARAFKATVDRNGPRQVATLTYGDFEYAGISATCTASVAAGDPLVRWSIAVQIPDNMVLEGVSFPQVVLRAPLGASVGDDAAVIGSTKGGIIRRPGELKVGSSLSASQPGNLAAQFGCYYDDRVGFFTAALDAKGYPKSLLLSRIADGVEFSWYRPGFATGSITQPYDIAMTTFSAPGGAGSAPTDWRDAADIYKDWALRQPWCATTYDQRADIPAWMKSGPAMVRFGRNWLAEPQRIERWLTQFWQKQFPKAPLITAYWGWEKHGDWVTPDYFPVFPSSEQFAQLVAKGRAMDAHAFPWPSGYHWTLTYDKRADGTFVWDDRQRFDDLARAHAVQTRESTLYQRTPFWLLGGDTACLCGGDPWTIRWWNQDICAPLARLGCEMIQVDQVVGGSFPACYATAHPHPPGPGLWQTTAFEEQLRTMLATMRKTQPDAVVCFEEPNEWFNHLVGIQDYRDCESPYEWASVFNYLYHEFLPTFQSNPRSNDLVMAAHCLVDGQIPHLMPAEQDLSDEVLVNGAFEPRARGQSALRGWDIVRGWQGAIWNGRASADAAGKHGGASSLRLENTQNSDIVQVSQNLMVSAGGFAVDHRYRLSAWIKTDHMAKPNGINFAFFASGMKSLNKGGRLPFPAAGAGWTRLAADFAVPADASLLRIMIHVDGPAKAWVDDMTLEELQPDGTATPAKYVGLSAEAQFMRRWVELYHGEARPWLQFGRMVHPPQLLCDRVDDQTHGVLADSAARSNSTMPAIFHNAFRAPDGREALILANATRQPRHVTLTWKGKTVDLDLAPAAVQLLR